MVQSAMHREWRPWRLEPPRFRLPAPLLAVVAPIAYFLTGILAASLSVKTDYVVTLWPPAAILVASLLRAPRSTWPALVALFLLADSAMGMLASGKIAAALIVSAANIGEGLIIAGTLQRLSYEGKWYLSGRWIATFLVSSVTAATVVAGVGSTILSFMDTGQFTMSWMSWAMADCLSVLTLAPFLLCWTEPSLRQGLRRRDWAEAVALTLILGAISYAALTTPLPLLFLIFPFLALTTVRSGLLGATAGTVTVALVGLWLTVQGSGPFAAAPGLSAVGHVIILQLFILAAALCAVPLAIVFTMRKSLAEEVQHHASIKRAALDNMAQGLIMFDAEQRLIICNRRYGELYKLPRNLRIPGTPVEAIAEWKATGPDMAAAGETARQILDAVRSPEPYREMELPDGRIIVVHARPLLGGGWVSTHEDVTEQRRAAQQIAHLASHDPLTDLPNRAFFRDHLQALISRTKRGEGFALLSLDLDRFKRVNDTLGHGVGDELLKQVAQRLRTIVRESDVVTRFGGDEFAILQTGVGSREEARLLADRVVRRLSEPFLIEGHQFDIGASLGIALCPGDTAEPADLLRKSDLALYRAKSEGGETYRFFEAGMDDVAHQRRVLESQLKAAIENGEFVLHYQPILDLESGVPTSFEALVRWQHPTRGLVMPDQFIAAAEDCGLIVRIGEWVLREALREAATWPEPLRVAVNLSPVQFRSGDLVQTVRSAIAAAGIAPERLDVELTESVLLEGTQSVLNTLEQLRLMGVGIALDDFGTGYSSLGYLRTFLFDRIKIDRSFIAEMGSPESYAIVHATIGLSRQLGMTTTAEGVETAEQAAVLKAEGCTSIQGYFVSRALSAEQAKDFLHGFTVAPEAEPRKRRARAACGETAQADAKFRRSLLPRAAAAR